MGDHALPQRGFGLNTVLLPVHGQGSGWSRRAISLVYFGLGRLFVCAEKRQKAVCGFFSLLLYTRGAKPAPDAQNLRIISAELTC
jgi:hypothetical protein